MAVSGHRAGLSVQDLDWGWLAQAAPKELPVPHELRFMVLRGMAAGFVLGGVGKFLIVAFLGATLPRVKLDYELITMVLYLGIGGTIFIQQERR